MEPTVNKTATNNRRQSVGSDSVKKKSPRACTPCRKRKVKCNSKQPCDRCMRTETTCVYDKPQQKKEPVKATIPDNHEPRLKALEAFLNQFSAMIEKRPLDPTLKLYTNPNPTALNTTTSTNNMISTTGQGLYVPDKYLRTDRTPELYNSSMSDWNPILNEIILKETASRAPPMSIKQNLLNIYFQFVDPVIPILHKQSFLIQNNNNSLLLNAIFSVSSRWDLAVTSNEEPRGWLYYQNAVHLLDQQQEPRLSTIQSLFFLLKYNEHVRRPGFIWRTRYYFQMIVRMCKDLGLARDVATTNSNLLIELEVRKRTFWAIFCYDIMMSIENGTRPNFNSNDCSQLDIPHVLPDETEEHEKILYFILLTRIMRNQSDIIEYLLDKSEQKEKKSFEQLTNDLKSTICLLTCKTIFPQKESMCYTVCFLYLASCFATILLHRPFALFNQPPTNITKSHQSHCTEAAMNIKIIVQLILDCEAYEDMYCSIRGIQQIVHYLSAAITVFKEAQLTQDLKVALYLTQKLASISPATEVIGTTSTAVSLKRKSLHHNYVYADDGLPNIPNHESLLGLLLYDR